MGRARRIVVDPSGQDVSDVLTQLREADVVGMDDEKFCVAGEAELFRKRFCVDLCMRFEERDKIDHTLFQWEVWVEICGAGRLLRRRRVWSSLCS